MKTETFAYHLGDTTFRGYLAYDAARAGKRPGVLVVHEAWGIGEHVQQRAERLAERGYVALAVDMFGEGRQAASNQEGLAWSAGLRNDLPTLRARIRAAFDALAGLPEVDPGRIASIGYCFGGTTSLELARSGAPAAGVVSFHGRLETKSPAEPQQVKARILVCTGADDPMIPQAQVQAFIEEMSRAGADYQVIVYGGAKHSFTNPRAGERGIEGLAYNQLADERSWNAMLSFFREIFGD
ncbi:MAG TPA: dienelactone hydrolase family protein [Bryobacteraceae bacterium]|nr:dienelactone hydrolase family protein [Bryobacteraceae bacterium]